MKITMNGLLQLGFTPLSERQHVYTYKPGRRAVVTGKLDPRTGSFQINGFTVPLRTVSDLAYMLEIVDYFHQAPVVKGV